ncbi:uncharacterized protein BDZ99DRAFT_466499, partial [Mytilinidion resinicola]
MSRAGGYRSSAGDLGFFEDDPHSGPRRGPERWDRERFERMGRRGPPERERGPPERERGPPSERDPRESFHFEEHDRGPGRSRLDIEINDSRERERRAPPARVVEKERFFEEDRFERPSRRRADFLDEPAAAEIANRALAPYRRKSIIERDFEPPARRPARPQYIRRQSSLDTFDRRPYPRYGDQERDEWRPPVNVPIPLPVREPRRRSPPRSRSRFHEEDYEEVRYKDEEPEEDYREVEVRREKSTTRRSKSKSRKAQSIRSSSSSFEEVSPVREPPGRKGKTRMPKRLAKKQVIVDLGYPFEEEDDFIIIRRALEKDQIDEIIKVSETYEEGSGNERTTYVYEDTKTKAIEPPPPPPPPPESIYAPPPPPSIHYAPPPPQSYAPPPPQSVHYSQSVRSASPPRHEHYEERIEESNRIGGPLQVLVPGDRRDERDIKAEIRRLEDERRLLKYERENDRLVDYEVIERREPVREVVRIEKDRKGRLALVRSA